MKHFTKNISMNLSRFTAAVVFLSLCACQKTGHEGPEVPETFDVSPYAEKGWDIYTGAGYRYGASIIVNDDSSIDLWLAATGGTFAEGVKTYLSEEKVAQPLGTDNTLAQYFEFDEDFACVSLFCPSWSSKDEGFTLSLYNWAGDYASTLAGSPAATARFDNYTDNSWLAIRREGNSEGSGKFPAGKYLWVMSEGTSNSGIWKSITPGSAGNTNAESYINGEKIEGQFLSMINITEGSSDVYWDKIVYMHSDDGGKNWSEEVNSLLPTEGSRDALSCCDPGAACWGGYYYIGYTSTENKAGRYNHVYMARSKKPDGPWEKWNGNGWGGNNPQPVVTFEGAPSAFGAGEPCMVVVDGTIYLYYSWNDWNSTTTRLSTAPASDENWPALLKDEGMVIDKTEMPSPDHSDVKYVERSKKFIAIHAVERDTDESYLQIWESEDGKNFTMGEKVGGELCKGIINAGMSGDASGHVRPDSEQYLCYAHSDAPRTWGHWATWWSPLTWKRQSSK